MGIRRSIGDRLAPKAAGAAPGVTSKFVHQALAAAIKGVGPLPGAAAAADKELREQGGDVEKAVKAIVDTHTKWAGAQGFVTNLGGLVTLAATVPANISGLALLQCRMVAGVAHLRGYDVTDPQVQNAILTAILGEESVLSLVKKREIPGTPMAIATAPAYDGNLDRVVAVQVASALMQKVAGKRLAVTASKRIPMVGGVVGASTDAYSTYRVGQYVKREFLPRRQG